MESGVGSQRRVTASVARDLEASVQRRELLQQVPQLVSDLVNAKPILGVPRQFYFHPENRRLYFLADTKSTDLHYVDIPAQEGMFVIKSPSCLTKFRVVGFLHARQAFSQFASPLVANRSTDLARLFLISIF
jgi:hypothetical protein